MRDNDVNIFVVIMKRKTSLNGDNAQNSFNNEEYQIKLCTNESQDNSYLLTIGVCRGNDATIQMFNPIL